jgi:hypothetical protein
MSSHAFHWTACEHVRETTVWEQLRQKTSESFDSMTQEQYRVFTCNNLATEPKSATDMNWSPRCCQWCTGCKIKTGTRSEAEEEQNEQREKKDHYGARFDSSHLMRTEIEFLWAVRKQETRPDQNRAKILALGSGNRWAGPKPCGCTEQDGEIHRVAPWNAEQETDSDTRTTATQISKRSWNQKKNEQHTGIECTNGSELQNLVSEKNPREMKATTENRSHREHQHDEEKVI